MDPTATRQVIEGIDAALARAGRTRDGFEIVITPNTADADTIREFADLGVDRLVLHLGSQKPEKVDRRLGELETLVSAAA